MDSEHRFPYRWNLADGYPAKGIPAHHRKVFGTFICGGGSTMGYKLAGYDHLGGVEIDPVVANIYRRNHHPRFMFNEDIRDFVQRDDIPPELYDLDVLDGSPPCTTFSIAGDREKVWGKEKRFSEGQKCQTLDDLVFVYCDLILKLRPKVCILENVSGLAKGNGKAYLSRIVRKLSDDYRVQVFLLNAATMGVPQKRQRVFVIGLRKDFNLPPLVLRFDEVPVCFGAILDSNDIQPNLAEISMRRWLKRRPEDRDMGDISQRMNGRDSNFNTALLHKEKVCVTITSNNRHVLYDIPRHVNDLETSLAGSYPLDYDSTGKDIGWLVGMSVPPVMTAQISYEIYRQWLSRIDP